MNRRSFIKLISSASAAAFVLDPEQLLWVPGEKKIFLPPERKLIYSADIGQHDWNSFGFAVCEMGELQKFLYEYKESAPFLLGRTLTKHVEIYETLKGLHYHPD